LNPPRPGPLLASPNSGADPLTYSIAAGHVPGIGNSTGLVSFGLSKLVMEHFEVTADFAYMHSLPTTVGLRCIQFGAPCPSSEWEISYIPVSLGMSGYVRGPGQSGPYAELAPSLYLIRWSMRGSAGSGNATAFTPGLKVGMGARIAITEKSRLDLGILYLLSRSGEVDTEMGPYWSGGMPFEGLKEVVPIARLSVSL
jgi:hypothetical protein